MWCTCFPQLKLSRGCSRFDCSVSSQKLNFIQLSAVCGSFDFLTVIRSDGAGAAEQVTSEKVERRKTCPKRTCDIFSTAKRLKKRVNVSKSFIRCLSLDTDLLTGEQRTVTWRRSQSSERCAKQIRWAYNSESRETRSSDGIFSGWCSPDRARRFSWPDLLLCSAAQFSFSDFWKFRNQEQRPPKFTENEILKGSSSDSVLIFWGSRITCSKMMILATTVDATYCGLRA